MSFYHLGVSEVIKEKLDSFEAVFVKFKFHEGYHYCNYRITCVFKRQIAVINKKKQIAVIKYTAAMYKITNNAAEFLVIYKLL